MRRRNLKGDLRVKLIRSPDRDTSLTLLPSMAAPLLIAVLQEGGKPAMLDGLPLPKGTAILIGHGTPSIVSLGAGSRLIAVHIPRTRLQAAASEHLGTPRRFGVTEVRLDRSAHRGALEHALERTADGTSRHSTELLEALIACLMEAPDLDGIFPIVRSVKAATDYVLHHIEEDCGPERLAAVAGVTTAWLRQNFRACLGISIAGYVQGVRLDMARARLLSNRESRPIAGIALACGFRSANAFSRAYAARFGEAPSAARARAAQRPS